jgi:hypothetical protein
VSARLWIARIMIAWGLLAGATALVTGSTSFAAMRFLDVAEAGFFPGIILYFTYWFPSRHHARIVSGFLIGNPSLRSVRRSASSAAARLSSRRPAVAREHPCPSTGRTSGACPGYRKDHIKALACGGPDAVWNLQWQTVADARAKDRWERKVCGH